MRATDFEYHHPVLLHELIVIAAFCTYMADREDVVWRFIKQYPERRALEHAFFLAATLLIGAGAALCSWARASADPVAAPARAISSRSFEHLQFLGEWLFAVGLASLAPLLGCIVLVVVEAIRLLRLMLRHNHHAQMLQSSGLSLVPDKPKATGGWGRALRIDAGKWGLFLTMIVFTITLTDRLAEYLAAASVLLWVLVNLPCWLRRKESRKVP
jgi:hypothetical protein